MEHEERSRCCLGRESRRWSGIHRDTKRCSEEPRLFLQGSLSRRSGTNPQELIAAAHAGCFAMQLHLLAEHGKPVRRIETTAQVCVEPDAGGGFSIRSSALALVAEVPGRWGRGVRSISRPGENRMACFQGPGYDRAISVRATRLNERRRRPMSRGETPSFRCWIEAFARLAAPRHAVSAAARGLLRRGNSIASTAKPKP